MTLKEQTEGEMDMNEMLRERADRLKKKKKPKRKTNNTEAKKGGSSSQRMGKEILNITNTWHSLG